ncbi:enoyl-CoA hydratase/isomerase family protein [Thermodesulforhabdus norvegica]|uniref:Enoyl-CoA hydratase/carnithine racemase n=1 Tax=Thermodesulforhabdus norvegica TaxID=39841 RepID=A0A1I4ULB1_9BACT|nr:enoyl-CoA hydratase/isomerase family protein [Thermodesulforhabdus norvegica]SFM89701.1 Enoyl-CoA hydratase/carnithine racemase [Thermodesulforhabdus norvegica]
MGRYMELQRDGSVVVMTLTRGDEANTFRRDVLEEYLETFDEIENTEGNLALLITSNSPKYWCTGIDLEWLSTQPKEYFLEFASLMDRVFLRAALLNLPTVGCLTGHTFAGGAILASALDFRFMREDRGWFCFPEVDIKIPFSLLMQEIVEMLPNPHAVKELILTGRRIGGREAAELRIVDGAYPPEELFEKSLEYAHMLSQKDRKTYTQIKHTWRRSILRLKKAVLEGTVSFHEI